jgi:pimeloyl-ACP methyl ester carboxylesterase
MARPTERSQRRLMRACMNDLQTLRERMDGRLEELEAYALDRARTPAMKKALRTLMPQLGMRPIPAADLDRITVPTTLIWGRHDLQVRLRVAEAASARYGWPLHVVEDAADDPAVEQPEAFLDALEAALAGFDDREQRRTA